MSVPERFIRQREEREGLARRLADVYAADLPQAVSDRVFSLAWEHGHAGGESDIEYYYIDFAALTLEAYRAGVA
jgi:hypothetical protein